MAVNMFSVKGYRSIVDSGEIALGPITLLVGKNNSGKTALLKALYLLQQGSECRDEDFHLRTSAPVHVSLRFDGIDTPQFLDPHLLEAGEPMIVSMQLIKGGKPSLDAFNEEQTNKRPQEHLSATRPNHLFVPVFTERRVAYYNEDVSGKNAVLIAVVDNDLTARLDGVANTAHKVGRTFHELMNRVFGMSLSTFASNQGKTPGHVISIDEGISLQRMGDGLSSMVGLLTELARGGSHIYLIEEPENGIHPEALSALLEVITQYSKDNQFVITTHSDQVVRHLGAIPSTRVHKIECHEEDDIPTTTIETDLDKIERRQLLTDMGYFFPNPTAWVVLEESSAQSVIEKILIPLLVPGLRGVAIVASGGASKVKPTLDDLERTVLCLHLGAPKNETWVFVDGDGTGEDVIKALQKDYKDWPQDRFQVFPAPMFEEFYPPRFADSLPGILNAPKSERRDLKKNLLLEVLAWARDNPDDAKREFAESARSVVDLLEAIRSAIS